MTKPLTDAACRKFAPGQKRRRIRDAGSRSLFLIIEPSGHKSWQMRFRRPDGKPGKITLGPFDPSVRELKDEPKIEHIGAPLSLAAARLLAQKVLRERKLGRDPIADHKARKHRQRVEIEQRAANTFASTARKFIEEHARAKTRRWYETSKLLGLDYGNDDEPSVLKGGLSERWADKAISSIDAHDVYAAIDEARRTAVPGIKPRNRGTSDSRARALHAALSSFFAWAQRHRRIENNPCVNVQRPDAAIARERVLNELEIVWFWTATNTVGEPFGRLLKVLLLTGARLNEVARMTYSELSADGATCSLSGHRTKNRKPHVVPLSPLVRDLIGSASKTTDVAGYMFTTKGSTPVSGFSRVKRRLDREMLAIAKKDRPDAVIERWRLHDLRRTCATGMAEIGVAPHIVEACLNHISGAKAGVAGTYNRAAYAAEKKAALERWAAHIQTLIDTQIDWKVLPFVAKSAS